MKRNCGFLVRASVLGVALAMLSACQSIPTKKSDVSWHAYQPIKASEVFGQHQNTKEFTAQARLVRAMAEHLSKERIVSSEYYTQEVPSLLQESLDKDADPLWVTIAKVRDYQYEAPEEKNYAFRQMSDYSDEEGLYLRYYDEVAGTTPTPDYDLTRLDGLAKGYELNAPVQRLHKQYRSCVKRASYELDSLVKQNPAITINHASVKQVSEDLSACLLKADTKGKKSLAKLTGYQAQDVEYLRHCVSGYRQDLMSVLSPNRTQKRYEGEAYDLYDTVYGHYAVCNMGYVASFHSEPNWYLNEATKTELELSTQIRQCALTTNQNKAQKGDYATTPEAMAQNFYGYFSCLDGAIEAVYNGDDGENVSAVDVLRSPSVPTSMADVETKYALLKEVVEEKEQEIYSTDEEEQGEYRGFLQSMFGTYFDMKKAELANKDEDKKPSLVGIGGLYGAVASEFLTTMKRTPEQMTARNVYQYDNTRIQVLSHHNPKTYISQAVLAMDFESPTASQSLKLPMQANFATGQVLVDTSAILPMMMWVLPPEHVPMPDEFQGQVGLMAFRIPEELTDIVPSDVIYHALQKGVVQGLSELNANIFTAVDISDDPFAKRFGATQAVKATFDATQVGELVSLVSKQVIKDLSAYVENNPDIYNGKVDSSSLSVAEELAQKSRQKHAKKIKELVEQWALLDKGYVSADVGGILGAILGVAPINIYQSNYYYLNAKGELVGQMARADIDSRVVGAKTQSIALTHYGYEPSELARHHLAPSLLAEDKGAFDGNAWLSEFSKVKTLQEQARLLRESYEETTENLENADDGESSTETQK